ncbi:D-2-hydroxyacid dehydrogenase [Paenibacillus sp. 481]|uniref:D-2-hydroxyacid dehydrogenase n=1 Tax=Paenibacillus sp. 481 TaxID=2835869 RepID=UPI001E60D29C|nr:D-2-hydroxyacid dehydrogenase [Paenibacillus sp. 481]UHA75912.1 D-2-hydroxyacid dehydrogenase [Paenibacillus sp. 481]
MRIVVLDGLMLNPGDLSWDTVNTAVQAAGYQADHIQLQVYDRSAPADVIDRAQGAAIVLTNKTRLTAETMSQLPDLRYIGVLATGYDVVDVAAARERHITVTNVPSYGTEGVAQFVFALLLAWCHRIERHDDAVKAGEWSRQADFSFWLTSQTELAGLTFGIIGFGLIGQQVARLAQAFGMKVLVSSRSNRGQVDHPHVSFVSQAELLQQADVISLHCPLNDDTRHMVNERFLQQMKRSALLINTARGALVHEQQLLAALEQGTIAGAMLDVLSEEPPATNHPLLAGTEGHERLIITPHIAWASQAARSRLLEIASSNIQHFLRGQPQHVVS